MRGMLPLFALWLLLLGGLGLSTFLPHGYIEPLGVANSSFQLFLSIVCVLVALKSHGRTKYVYFNLAAFFAFILLMDLDQFVDSLLFPGSRYAGIYFHLYVSKFGLDFRNALCFLYILIDLLLRKRGVIFKYSISLLVTTVILIPLYYTFLTKPSSLWKQDEYSALRQISKTRERLIAATEHDPDDFALASELSKSSELGVNGKLELASAIKIVQALRPHLGNGGDVTVFWKPINKLSVLVNSFVLILIFVFLIQLLKHNLPCSAYLEKIMVFLFIFIALDTFHYLVFMNSPSIENYHTIFKMGQVVTCVCLFFGVYVFVLRLNFVRSTAGQYYERMLEEQPDRVTRWRDEIDTFILKTFSRKNDYLKHIGHFDNDNEPSERIEK